MIAEIIGIGFFILILTIIINSVRQSRKEEAISPRYRFGEQQTLLCVHCGKNEAGNDNLCDQCRNMLKKVSEDHPYHLMAY